jgi:cobyrinic acid a,c-diamide synthase
VPSLPPRIVVAGTHSGVGKTTIATGLIGALRRAGHRVGAAKVGPDFIDPGYHALAAGRPSRNLDPWMSGAAAVTGIAARAGEGTDLLVVEGVMGLFDGAGDGTPSSTADVAALLDAPVLLVVDASAMSQSIAALVHGFASHDTRIQVAGVVLNRVGSPGHEQLLRDALAPLGLPVVGVLGRDDRFAWRDRHLGLVPVAERGAEVAASLDVLTALIADRCDLAAIAAIAAGAALRDGTPLPLPEQVPGAPVRIAVAAGPAFSFMYPDNLEALAAAGAELVPFDPCRDPGLPGACTGLIAGGGFPETFAEALSENLPMLADVRERVGRGLVTWAECGGLLWLCDELDGRAMAGVVAAGATMTPRLTLGYRVATATADTPLGQAGTELRGHEFHYSAMEPAGELFAFTGRHGRSAGGFGGPRLAASYLHTHLAARPDVAQGFVRSCSALCLPYVE